MGLSAMKTRDEESTGLLPCQQRMGNLEVRLATTAADIDAAQALRYRVFYQEMLAKPLADMQQRERDFDEFDAVCDHLLVIDHDSKGLLPSGKVVGTYRLIRKPMAEKIGRFYSASEYDIRALLDYPGEIMELGRSCVDANYRHAQTMMLLWRGIAAYINQHAIQLMFGWASLTGTDPEKLRLMLSYLY